MEGEGKLFTIFQESENVIIWQQRRSKAGHELRELRVQRYRGGNSWGLLGNEEDRKGGDRLWKATILYEEARYQSQEAGSPATSVACRNLLETL